MIRTRIPPSPTGEDIHIGNLYTALINYAFAKKNNGKFIIRIEDTDRQRFVPESEEKILHSLKAFGLIYDEGPDIGGPFSPYRQSERLPIYQKYAKELIDKGVAYYCSCSKERIEEGRKKMQKKSGIPKYDRFCLDRQEEVEEGIAANKPFVIRLKIPDDQTISFSDLIRGEISFDSNTLDDQILIKSDGYPTYFMGVVVDDHLMEITHVIRGEEWISSNPKQVLLYQAFGWKLPIYAHLPILRNPDRSKLSKRKNPVWASWYLSEGFLPEAVLNYLALMGWSHPEQKEIFSIDEFIKEFTLERVQTAGPVFDTKKLEWMNGEYIRKMKNEKLKMKIIEYFGDKYPADLVEKTTPLIRERIKTLKEYDNYCGFFIKRPNRYDIDLSKYVQMSRHLDIVISSMAQKKWRAEVIGEKMQQAAKDLNMKNSEFFMILRVVIAGKKITPPLNESMEILGKEECLKRIKVLT